jgi:glycosyltransferase involved in cell wall biosynthesis
VRLSILIPTRDRLEFLKLSLASAQAQTVEAIEILVSDDGSSDRTAEYVQAVAASDPRVRLLTGNPTPGAFENINYLIGHASGEAVAVLGDDDLLLPPFGERLLAGLDDPTVNVAYGLFDVIAEDGRSLVRTTAHLRRHYRFAETPAGRSMPGSWAALVGQLWLGSCVYRTAVIRQLGIGLEFGSAADWDLALRAAERGAIFFVPEVLWLYRDHQETISRAASASANESAIAVLGSRREMTPSLEALRLSRLRTLLATQAWKSVVKDPELARASIRRYDGVAGHRLEPRRLLSGLLLQLPANVRSWLHDAAVSAVVRSRARRS